MKYGQWDFENDVIATKEKPLFDPSEDMAKSHMGSAYAVDTAEGIFFQYPNDNFGYDLYCIDRTGEYICMENIVVVASDMKYSAMIVHVVETGENYLVDTRGVFFFLDAKVESLDPAHYDFTFDRKTGFYTVSAPRSPKARWMIRGVDKKTMFMFMLETTPDYGAEINKKFSSYLRKKPEVQSLFLTCPKTKKGRLLMAILEDGLEYEVIPNVFANDDSVNVRIPRSVKNLGHRGFHFLDSRYKNTYAINGVSIENLLGVLDLDYKTKSKIPLIIPTPSEKQYKAGTSVIDTLRECLELPDNKDVYKKLLKKIITLFEAGEAVQYENYFEGFRIPYPENPAYGVTEEVFKKNLETIKSRLEYAEQLLGSRITNLDSMDSVDIYTLGRKLYKLSNERRKKEIEAYETMMGF